MRNKKSLSFLITLGLGLSAPLAGAFDFNPLDPAVSEVNTPFGPQADAIGRTPSDEDKKKREGGEEESDQKVFLYPAVNVGFTYDDNIYRQETDKESATIFRLLPSLIIQGGSSNVNLSAGYRGSYAVYNGGPNDDDDGYADSRLFAAVTGYGNNTNYSLRATYTRGHDSLSGNSIGDNLDSYDKWNGFDLTGRFGLGNADDRFKLGVTATVSGKEQDNLSSIDFNSTALAADLGIKVGEKTRAVLVAGIRNYDYVNSTQSGNNVYGRVGVTWQATAKTKGIITYGREEFSADNPGTPIVSPDFGPAFGINKDTSNSTWSGLIHWQVRSRDQINLRTSKGTRISNGTGSNKIATRYVGDWAHDWNDRVRSNLGLLSGTDDFNGVDRSDDLTSFYLAASYKFRRNLLLRGDINYEDRDSTVILNNYDRTRYSLFLNWAY